MQALTASKPKCLLELHNRRLIDHQIHALKKAGVASIALVRGYLAETIQSDQIDHYFFNANWARSNMVSTLLKAREWLAHADTLVSYADIFYTTDIVEKLMHCSDPIAIAYDVNFESLWRKRFDEPLADLETFRVDAEGYLQEIGQKPHNFEEIQGQYMGLLKISPAGFRFIEASLSELTQTEIDALDCTTLLNRLLKAGVPVKAVPNEAVWGEVDNATDLALYHEDEAFAAYKAI